MQKFEFTFSNLKKYFQETLQRGYSVVGCADYCELKKRQLPRKLLIVRIDIDESCKKAKRVAEVFNELNFKGTFFVRLHAQEYNPFDFENYLSLKYIKESGHEIGY